jgi:hypothetical protein
MTKAVARHWLAQLAAVQVLSITHGMECHLALMGTVQAGVAAGGDEQPQGPPTFRVGLPLPHGTTVVGAPPNPIDRPRNERVVAHPEPFDAVVLGRAAHGTALDLWLFGVWPHAGRRGVLISTLLLGLIINFVSSPTAGGIKLGFNQMPFAVAMLIAACLRSTDAGATIGLLGGMAKPLPKRLSSLLELESSVNDPAAIFVRAAVVGLFTVSHNGGGELVLMKQIQLFLQKSGSGLIVDVILGYPARFSLEQGVDHSHQLLVLGVAIALLSYGLAETLGAKASSPLM